jgi:hypothetical protein
MTEIIDTKSKRFPSSKLVTGVFIASIFALGTLAGSASAQVQGYYAPGYHHHWNGGYYAAPPVVYGSRYGESYYGTPYYPPPVIYGPGIGINLPGVSIGIH